MTDAAPSERQARRFSEPKFALVTGATGFIGGRVVEALQQRGIRIRALVRNIPEAGRRWKGAVEAYCVDFTRPDTLVGAMAGADTVFHLAGYAHADDEGSANAENQHWAVTVSGTQALLDEALRTGVRRLVYFSSVKAMGEAGADCKDETEEPRPTTAYGKAKLEAERLVRQAAEENEMHVCVLRLPLVYGPGVKGNLVRMIEVIERGRFPPLPETGNRRSMVHVDDVVQAALLGVENPRADGQTYIVTDGQTYSIRQIYVLIADALGKIVPRWSVPEGALRSGAKVGDLIGRLRGRRFFFNSVGLEKLLGSAWWSCEKIRQELGYCPTRTFEASVEEMIAAYRRTERAQD